MASVKHTKQDIIASRIHYMLNDAVADKAITKLEVVCILRALIKAYVDTDYFTLIDRNELNA